MNNKTFYGILICSLLVVLVGMRVDVMEVDAAQYAEMSWEMLTTKSFLQLHEFGRDYLDKPPLLFWLSSLSFLLLGVSNFTYKLPSLLFALLAVGATYRLAKLYYTESTARLSAIMLATSQAVFLMTNDVRTDTLLMGSVIFAIWQWAAFTEHRKWKHLIGGSIGIGLALLSKGPIGLIAVGAALVPHLLLKRKWRVLFDGRLLVTAIIIGLMLLPMCIGLYRQYGTDGLRFYFWTQSFGRITGESKWNNHPDAFFLVHTTAWAILPWTLFFFWGWMKSVYDMVKMRFVPWSRSEFISISGFTLVLIALSLSNYQLPHYIFVVLPLASVIAAKCFEANIGKWPQALMMIHAVAIVLFFVVAGFLWYAFSSANYTALAGLGVAFIVFVGLAWRTRNSLILIASGILLFNFYLSMFFFPALLRYQPEGDFGRFVHRHVRDSRTFLSYRFVVDYSLAFYARQWPIATLWSIEELEHALTAGQPLTIVTTQQGMDEIRQRGMACGVMMERWSYKIARLNTKFLNPATRHEVCEKLYLINMHNQP